MRKLLLALAVTAVLVVAVVVTLFWLWPGGRDWARQRLEQWGGKPQPGVTREEVEEKIPPEPDISLQINREHEPAVFQGTPLIFSVRLANPRAMNAAAENQVNQAHAEELEARVARGKLPREKVATKLTRLRQLKEIPVVKLGEEAAGWEQFIRFVHQLPDGKQEPLGWLLKLLTPPTARSITLDAETTAQLDYALEPAAAAGIAPGEYQLLAVLEVAAQAPLPADRWRGRVESEPVKLAIREKPARLAAADQEKMELDLARYYAAVGEPARSLEHAQKVLALNPKSIPARILVGEAKEAQGDLKGALAAYQTATREFYRQYPDSYEAPLYLIYKSSSLIEKLQGRP